MQRPILLFIIIGTALLSGIAAHASYYPPACVPNPYFEVLGNGNPSGTILFNPGLSTNCAPWSYDAATLDHPAEAAWLHYRVEHEYRIGQTLVWNSEVIASHTLYPETLAANDGGFATYSLNHSLDIFPGQSKSTHHRYRLVVEVGGLYSNSGAAPYTNHGEFSDVFATEWVDYVVEYEVNPSLGTRPGELVAPQREEQSTTNNLQSR